MRAVLFVYLAGIAVLAWLFLPGAWQLLALVPVWAMIPTFRIVRPPRGAHADTGRLDLPAVDYGSMDRAAELAWRERYGITADDMSGAVSGAMTGTKAEVWPNHDSPGWPGDDASGAWGPLPAPLSDDSEAPAPPAPAPPAPEARPAEGIVFNGCPACGRSWADGVRGTHIPTCPSINWSDWPEPTRKATDDTLFRSAMAADVLADIQARNADAALFMDRSREWAARYLARLREAL